MLLIADIFAVNKSDRDGADKLHITLNNFLNLIPINSDDWKTEVIKTVAKSGTGIKELFEKIEEHYNFLKVNCILKKKTDARYIKQVKDYIAKKHVSTFWNNEKLNILKKEIARDISIRIPPYDFSEKLFSE